MDYKAGCQTFAIIFKMHTFQIELTNLTFFSHGNFLYYVGKFCSIIEFSIIVVGAARLPRVAAMIAQ